MFTTQVFAIGKKLLHTTHKYLQIMQTARIQTIHTAHHQHSNCLTINFKTCTIYLKRTE
jgi:hypothetical protein